MISENFWNQFGAIYCINIKERTDRRASSQKVFSQLNIPVQYHEVSRHPTSGVEGCFQSHMQCTQKAYDAGCENVVIFEDDPLLPTLKVNTETENMVTKFLTTNKDWDLFYLGACPNIFFETNRTVCKTKNASIIHIQSLCAHAYVMSRRGMKKFLQLSFGQFEIAIDALYMLNKHAYGIFPSWFYQSQSASSIDIVKDPIVSKMKMFAASSVSWTKNTYAQYVPVPLVYVTTLFLGLLLACILGLLFKSSFWVFLVLLILFVALFAMLIWKNK